MEKGRKDFHVSIIKESYRIRGNDARTQINTDEIIIVEIIKVKDINFINNE